MCEDGYNTALCDCCNDTGICCSTCLCGWTGVPAGKAWARSRRETCELCHCFPGASAIWTRSNIRKLNPQWKGAEQYCNDCCMYWYCGSCGTCQDLRQLDILDKNGLTGNTPAQPPMMVANVVNQGPPGYGQPPPALGYGASPPPQGYGVSPQPPGYGAAYSAAPPYSPPPSGQTPEAPPGENAVSQ
jgi:hypothetical protein